MTWGRGRLALFVAAGVMACSGDTFQPAAGGSAAGTSGAAGSVGDAGQAGQAGTSAGEGGSAVQAGASGDAGSAAGVAGGGATSGGGGAAGVSGGGGESGGGSGGTAAGCSVLYVASNGSLLADGCGEQTPLRTLGGALEAARTRAKEAKPVAEIRVCAGVYEETQQLLIDLPVKVRGSWSCSASPWALPAKLDADSASSSIVYATPTGLRITEPKPLAASFQGFFLAPGQPPPAGTPSICVEIAAGASPLLEHDNLCQTSVLASGPSFGAIGLSVGIGSNAIIRSSVISSALGRATNKAPIPIAGSIGALIDDPGASFVFSNNRVGVKEGTVEISGRPATMGVLVRAGGAGAVLADNVIGAGEGRYLGVNLDDINTATASLGSGLVVVRADNAPATSAPIVVRGGSVRGGVGSAPAKGGVGFAAGAVTYGIEVGQVGPNPLDLRLERVRVYGGDPVAAPHATIQARFAASFGVAATGARVTAVSSLLHGGGLLRTTAAPRAVVLFQDGSLDASLTTIVGGEIPVNDAVAPAGRNQIMVHFAGASTTAKLRRSLLIGSDLRSYAFFGTAGACAVRGTAPAENGYLVDTEDTAYVHYETASPGGPANPTSFVSGSTGCPVLAFSTDVRDAATASHFKGKLAVIGRLDGMGVVQTLPACADTASCLAVLFPGYQPTNPSEALGLLDSSLRPACSTGIPAVLLGKPGTSADVSDDLLGTPRKSAISVGLGAFVPSCK